MQGKKHLIVIGGPTASGKTTAAIALAQHFGTEILSADSRQFYREMSIGTAKPTPAELAAAPHHFINSLSVEQAYSVGDFEQDALRVLDEVFSRQKTAVLTGGSGLFLRAVCEGLDKFPPVPPEISHELQARFEAEGIGFLQQELAAADPAYFATVDQQNPVRLLRAVGVWRASGQPFSSFRTGQRAERNFEPIYLLLDLNREELYDRINQRVDAMLAAGLLAEAEALFPKRHLNALQTVGYQELFDYFSGKTSQAEAVELIKRNSRRYAKRQLTWFRKREHWTRFRPDDTAGMIAHVERNL